MPIEIKSVRDPKYIKLDELPESSALPPSSLPATESVWYPITALTILGAAPTTIVFTIKLPNELSEKSLQVMAAIADDTRTAIMEFVNSYLDLQSIPNGIQVQRKVTIKYGAGRNGPIDVSTLEVTTWPQYLDYFRQYTRIPELTVDIMES
ncbi:hypothetical protein VTL71DRAFT_9982 [Oculimacula yallundae]|uniref:Uncharacterized protein n=1 Tax=Oculimacula yallundae TaxID=86028 RepID=A0ABR4BPZ5_9HELO